MFYTGSLYQTKISIPIWPADSFFSGKTNLWIVGDDFFTVLEKDTHHFLVHTRLGVFKTSNLYQYTDFENFFEWIE